jgi:hypothetical protein
MKDHPIQHPEDYFTNFISKITGKNTSDLASYEMPTDNLESEFTMEDKLAYDKKEQQVQAILNRWQEMWGRK